MQLVAEKLAYHVVEAAEAIGLSESTLWREIKAGNLQSIKAGGRRLILKTDLEAYLNAMPRSC